MLLGKERSELQSIRPFTLHQTISNALSIRRGDWKFLDHKGSGGNNYDNDRMRAYRLLDTEPDAPGQLYNLASDPGETHNLYNEHPDVVGQLKTLLEKSKSSGRSRLP